MANLVMASTPGSKNIVLMMNIVLRIGTCILLNTGNLDPKPKKSTPSKKNLKLADNAGYVDDDEALMKAIALSLQDSLGDAANKTPPQSSDTNESIAEKTERNPTVRKDDSGKRKRKNIVLYSVLVICSFSLWLLVGPMKFATLDLVTSRVQMSEDELILHFFQFDGKGGINLRDLRRVAASHDFTWNDEEMENMIKFFDSNEDGKLSLEDFTKIVELCNMRQGPENTEPASVACRVNLR
ncbi:calmodulin-related protein [Artemisia annua]|uniref:Calmodulin-related protein n=1 Tax=Artemisia annua TaxID=35608 RepID=A0A2U1PMM4_ARTAN|nr:calmodulin-related protein [Artemisia annua]